MQDTFSFVASDGKTYTGNAQTVESWLNGGNILPNQIVTNTQTGQTLTAAEVVRAAHGGAQGFVQGSAPNPGIGSAPGAPAGIGYARPYSSISSTLPGFNWGAFFLNWIWGLNHKKPQLLIILAIDLAPQALRLAGLPGYLIFAGLMQLTHLGFAIYFGTQGNTWAIQSGRFSSDQECLECQKIWGWWGFGLALVGCICGIVSITLLSAVFLAMFQH